MADLDAIYEAAVMDDWEEMNADNCPDRDGAIKKLESAIDSLKEAAESLLSAADKTSGTIHEDRIASLADEVNFLVRDIERQKGRLSK